MRCNRNQNYSFWEADMGVCIDQQPSPLVNRYVEAFWHSETATETVSSAALTMLVGPLANSAMTPSAPRATVASKRETGKRRVSARSFEDRTPIEPP